MARSRGRTEPDLALRAADLTEQQAYLSEVDGRIGWMRVLCSGYRPVESDS